MTLGSIFYNYTFLRSAGPLPLFGVQGRQEGEGGEVQPVLFVEALRRNDSFDYALTCLFGDSLRLRSPPGLENRTLNTRSSYLSVPTGT